MVCEARRIFCVATGPSVCPGVVRWLHSVRTDNLTQSGPVVLYSAVLAHTPTIQVQKLSLAWYSQTSVHPRVLVLFFLTANDLLDVIWTL